MKKQNIEILIEKIQSLGTVNTMDISIPLNLACQILPPEPWEPKRLEEILEIKLPESVQQLWNKTSGLRLFEDTTHGQWGLIVWSPYKTIKEQEKKISQRPEDFQVSDLILGEFLGDSELLVLRCNEQTPDFGEVMIALPLDEREEWYKAASSLEEFLSNFIAARGEKFWENRAPVVVS
ncbi:hypothetical protein F7734_24580 [Scytonema sp. UIC 10036]|uniref:SMI1/KNR4 family protein n=1 Tax=Scytonema sp. UIC 10036 TaxID=2304196 RepID=UPI0012DAA50F|nr:SMI1/KNR4 family protein [Scytonema sp. UIC 10036]MUG95367.1 hypothetical protein [Scytonema sp. UIC 10036]